MTYLHDHNDANIINLVKSMDYNAAGQPIIRTSSSQSGYNTGGNLDGRVDAFGRLRVSEPVTLFDSSFRYGDNDFNWSNYQTSGDAVLSHLPNESSMSLYLGTTANEEIIRETKRVFQYQPGKSLLVLNTFCMAPAKANLRQRVGYFGINNGIYFEQNSIGYNMVRRSYTGGAVDNTQVSQSAWNVDPLDGTGPSGVTADFSKTQIFWMDVEWLGVGSVRTGFVINGQFLICHIFHHANILDKVYMTTATLPIRYEIKNTGTTPTSSTMRQICSSVMSEGGYTPSNTTRSASSAIGGKNISDSVFTPLVAIRLRSGREDSVAVPISADLFGLQQAAFKWAIIKSANVVGGSFVPAPNNSSVEYNITADSQNSGIILQEGVFVGATKGGAQGLDLRPYAYSMQLTRRLDSTREALVLCALATSNNDDAVGTLTWQEDV